MPLNTDHLSNCINTLEASMQHLQAANPNNIEYEIFLNATIKGFELTLETSGKLLRKALKLYASNPRSIDELVYKDVLRHAAKHGLLENKEVEDWFKYRDHRNNTAHLYGKALAIETLKILPSFINDTRRLQNRLQEKLGK